MGLKKDKIYTVISLIYFFGIQIWIIFLMIFAVPLYLDKYLRAVITSGFSSENIGAFIIIFSLFMGLSFLIPALRKIYEILPWLFPLVVLVLFDDIIAIVSYTIINSGFQIVNVSRHHEYITMAIMFAILSRLAMSVYYYLRPITQSLNRRVR